MEEDIPKIKRVKQALKKDKIYTFYDVDEKTRTIRFNRELIQQFLSNLKLRDVVIPLALLSSSHDTIDLSKMNVGTYVSRKATGSLGRGTERKRGSIPHFHL